MICVGLTLCRWSFGHDGGERAPTDWQALCADLYLRRRWVGGLRVVWDGVLARYCLLRSKDMRGLVSDTQRLCLTNVVLTDPLLTSTAHCLLAGGLGGAMILERVS